MFLAPLLVPLVGRVSWWWAARQARGPVAGRERRIRRVLGEFRAPRSAFVTLPAVGLDPHLVWALGDQMGFVFQATTASAVHFYAR